MKSTPILSWITRLIPAAIFLLASVPKLTSDPTSVEMFNTLGMGDAGRYFTGIAEIAAAVLLIIPKTAGWGGLLGVGLMIGALGAHAVSLGFAGDAGVAAIVAVVALAGSAITLLRYKAQVPVLKNI